MGVLVLPASTSCPSSRFENYCGQSVTTYHYDNLQTGWNNRETMLVAANFPKNFGIVATATLDDQVDAQPLVVQHLPIGLCQWRLASLFPSLASLDRFIGPSTSLP